MSEEKDNLPKLVDVINDVQIAKDTDKFNWILSKQPSGSWVKKNKYAGNALYLPIDKIEYLLKRLFKDYKIEVRNTKMMLNSVMCEVRVHYMHPVINEWRFHDGVGACEVQTASGSGALKADMSNVQRGAMEKAVPIAKTNGVKNACKNFGKLFGSDLNRNDTMPFQMDDRLHEMEFSAEDFKKVKASVKKGTMSIDKANSLYPLSDSQIKELEELV